MASPSSDNTLKQTPKRRRGENAGEHFAFFKGALVVGTDWKSLLGTILIIVAPCGVWFGFVAPKVGPNISWALVAVIAIELILAMVFLGLTALRDPGFFPRDDPNRPEAKLPRPAHKDHQVNGYVVQTKFCTTCNHWRPPRCSHCAVCDNCVEKFDHHCPWVGTCVGLRNYRYFLCFIFTCTILCLSIFAFCLWELFVIRRGLDYEFGRAIRKEPANIVLIVYAVFACCFVGGLSGFHIYLTSTNQTTYEHFRHRYSPTQGNPYNRGWWRNWKEASCSKMPKRRREPLLEHVIDIEMGYVGDEEAIPAVTAVSPWQPGAQAGTNGGMLNPVAHPVPSSTAAQGDSPPSSRGGSPHHPGHLVAPHQVRVQEPEQAGTISGVQSLHTKDREGEEAIQLPHSRAASFGGSSYSSYTSAVGRRGSFTTQASSSEDQYYDPMSRAVSRPDSFVTASGMSFPAQQQQPSSSSSFTQGAPQGSDYVSIPVEGRVTGAEASHMGQTVTRDEEPVLGHSDALSAVPPSRLQPGWH